MWVVLILPWLLLLSVTPAFAEPGFSEKYERDYTMFNPLNQYRPDNPLNPINSVDPNNPLDPINRYNPRTPFEPLNRPHRSDR